MISRWLWHKGPKFWNSFRIALSGLTMNKLRTGLSTLGIIFGVAAVIAMLSIGSGAKQQILKQMKMFGANNIVVKAKVKRSDEEGAKTGINTRNKKSEEAGYSPGLTLEDVRSIREVIPGISKLSAEVIFPTFTLRKGKGKEMRLVGVTPAYFPLNQLTLAQGNWFSREQRVGGKPVCIIGQQVKSQFFSQENPIGKRIKCGEIWLKVVGVLSSKAIHSVEMQDLDIRNLNKDIYAPLNTVLTRFNDRSVITKKDFQTGDDESSEGKSAQVPSNYHQIDQLTLQVDDTKKLRSTATVVARLLKRRHHGVSDIEVKIPQLLLKQKARTRTVFNIVLGAIAGISLLVGGIGIMNVMLTSVVERVREIGLRLAVGATKRDIMGQFLMEAVLISFSGGLIGILLGVGIASLISYLADIPTIVTFLSVILSFGVSSAIGLIFGFMPARRAARLDPIEALRYE